MQLSFVGTLKVDASLSKVQHSHHLLQYFPRNPGVSWAVEAALWADLLTPDELQNSDCDRSLLEEASCPLRISPLSSEDKTSYREMICQPCCVAAGRLEYTQRGLGIWLAHAAFPPPLLSLDLHSWHKLLLQYHLSSSTEFDKNSWVFCIFTWLLMCRLLERNQHSSGREERARRISWEGPERCVKFICFSGLAGFLQLYHTPSKTWMKHSSKTT